MNILFDLDDTLYDKSASLRRCGNALFGNFLATTEIEQVGFVEVFLRENCLIQPKIDVFRKLSEEFNLPESTAHEMLNTFDRTFHTYSQSFENVLETFDFLKNLGVKIGCVTNGRDFFQRNKISALGLESYFDVILTSGGFGAKKPDHKIFLAALHALNANPSDSAFVGDSLQADIIPAKELGMVTIWKSDNKAELPAYVDYRLKDFANFQEIWQTVTMP